MRAQNIEVQGKTYEIKARGLWVEINGERHKLKKLKNRRIAFFFGETELPIPEANVLLVSGIWSPELVVDGKYVKDGKPYLLSNRPPWWCYLFLVLYVLGFLFLVGGAIGAMAAFLGAFLSLGTSLDLRYSTGVRVLMCVGILLACWAVAFFIAVVFLMALGGLV